MQRNAPDPLTLAVVVATPTPYFTHFYARLAREVAGLRVVVLYTHARPDWPLPENVPFGQELVGTLAGHNDWSWRQYRADWRFGKVVCKAVADAGADAVYLSSFNTPDRWRLLRWASRRGLPAFAWSDANGSGWATPNDSRSRARQWARDTYFRWLDRRVTLWLAAGHDALAYYRHHGLDPQQVALVPYEPDYDLAAQAGDAEAARVRTQLNLPADRPLIVVSGRFVSEKGIDRAIEAFAAVADRRPAFDLVVAGDGPEKDALQRLVPDSLRPRVHFVGFVERTADVAALYRAGSVLLHPARREPWGLVVNEAAAAGMAIVASDTVGAATELVEDGVNGRRVAAGDAEALRLALLDVTDAVNLPRMRAASAAVLKRWRDAADPVAGVRRALAVAFPQRDFRAGPAAV